MNEMDTDGLILCRMQAEIFELSLKRESSSPVFIRRFMNSDAAARMDKVSFLNTSQSELQVLDEIEEAYHNKAYGTKKYDKEELYWMGYIYRYWAFTYGMKSRQIYPICNGGDLRRHYLFYHTLSPEKAIERILEEKGYEPLDGEEMLFEKSESLIEEKLHIK